MRKTKKIRLNQNHFLSSHEMVELNGGDDLANYSTPNRYLSI